jgi:hypothetical protein
VRCPGCAAEISVLRDECPHCGTPTDRVFDQLDQPGGRERERSPQELARNRKTVLWIGGGILLLMAAMGNLNPFGHHHRGFDPRALRIDTRSGAPVSVGAAELFEAYHTDSDAAYRRFGGREIEISGEFLRTVPDGYGSIDMRLKTNHPDLPLGIDLDSHSVDAATKLEPGQTVTLSCRRVAGSGDDPWLQDCVLQPPGRAAPAAAPIQQVTPAAPAAPATPQGR